MDTRQKMPLPQDPLMRLRWYQQREKILRAVRFYEPPMNEVMERAKRIRIVDEEWWWNESAPALEYRVYEHFDIPRRDGRRYYPPICVEEEIRKRTQTKLRYEAHRLAMRLYRHRRRVNTIRDELMLKVHRRTAIQTCRHGFKEELMQVAWHPDRVGRILETYGWDVLDNLLGVE